VTFTTFGGWNGALKRTQSRQLSVSGRQSIQECIANFADGLSEICGKCSKGGNGKVGFCAKDS